jgi:peptide/nickel transport system substrate-binding protein
MRSKRSKLLALVAGASLLTACRPDSRSRATADEATEPVQGGTLVFAKSKDANRLDPADVTDGESSAVTENVFDGLLQFKNGSTEIEPALATHWDVAPDGRTYTFHLRQGVTFHDGTPCDAAAVKFSFDRQRKPLEGQIMEYWQSFFATSVGDVEVADARTVRVHMQRRDATFLSKLAMFSMGIVSPTAARKWGADFSRHPVGTGPFKFVAWKPNEKIVLAANPDYWGGRPYLDRVIFKPVLENSVRLLELEVGGVGTEAGVAGMDGINPDDIPRVLANPELQLLSDAGLNVGYLALNTQRPPLDDKRVRQALNYAIDKRNLLKAFFADGKIGIVAKNPLPPILWGHADDLADYPHDPELARRLLAEAGHGGGLSLTLWAMPVARPYMPLGLKIGEVLQEDLREVGIKTEIVTHEWATYLDKMSNGDHTAALIGWVGDYGDPDNFLYTFFHSANARKGSSSNYAFYKNPAVDKLLDAAREGADEKQRAALYRQVQTVVHDDAPWVPLFHARQMAVLRRDVRGYRLQPTGSKLFHKVWLAGSRPRVATAP